MRENNRINLTSKNFLTALLIALSISTLFSLIYTLMRFAVSILNHQTVEFWDSLTYIKAIFPAVFIFFGGISFIVSFALLQRFRIKS